MTTFINLFGGALLAALASAGLQAPSRLAVRATIDTPREATRDLRRAARDFATRPPAAWRADDPADSLYRTAREQLNRGDYPVAARTFARIVQQFPRSVYAGDALYWQAYAHYSAGGRGQLEQAARALETQRTSYPRASTRGDADALAVRVRGALAQLGDAAAAQSVTERATKSSPCPAGQRTDDNDDDERIAAMNALMQMNAERALPILRTVLARRDACSVGLRQKAVFIVSQLRGPETEAILLDVVRSDPDREVKKKAVFWMGQVNTTRAAQELTQILRTSTDNELREKAVEALAQQRSEVAQAAVRAVAEDDRAPEELREKAVFWIGQRRSAANAAFLRDLFDRLGRQPTGSADAVRQKILSSLSQMRGEGNDRWLMEVAADPKHSVQTRKQAIFGAGQTGVGTADLSALYGRLTARELKQQVIWALSEQRDPAAVDRLMEIARRDADPELRKKAIFWLGHNNRDPRVRQFLLDIINR